MVSRRDLFPTVVLVLLKASYGRILRAFWRLGVAGAWILLGFRGYHRHAFVFGVFGGG